MQRKVTVFAALSFTLLNFVLPSSAQSNLTESYDNLFLLVTIISALVLLLVVALWGYFMYQFREDNEEVERNEISHSTARKLEIGWTAVAILIVIFLMVFSYPVLFNEYDDSDSGDAGIGIVVQGTANWQWRYHLPNGTILNATSMNNGDQVTNITLTVGETYTFTFWNTAGFIHSYFVEDLNIKMDVVPGVNNTYTFTVQETGSYQLLCAEFCGALHSNMKGFVNVEAA